MRSATTCVLLALLTTGCFITPGPPAQPEPYQQQGDPYAQQEAPQTECKMGSDGQQACGYHCQMGSDGVVACANTPDGTCAMQANGQVVCSEVAPQGAYNDGPPTECKLNSDGTQSCGYNCRMGSNGYNYCSTIPSGQCALNSDGTFACP